MRVAAVGVLAVTMLAACGSGATSDEWAGQVCAALTPWRTTIADLNGKAQRQLSTAQTPAEARASLLDLLAGGESASETARAAVASAGTPDADGGAEVASRFVASLTGTRDAYARARADLTALPTNDATTFYQGVAAVLTKLNTEYAGSGVDTSKLDSPALRQSFEKVDKCR
jgi:hypothetical protein